MHPADCGEPLAFNRLQARRVVDIEYVLRHRFDPHGEVYLGIDQSVYYTDRANPQSVDSDASASLDVPNRSRDIHRNEKECKPPDWVIQIASRATYRYDVDGKKDMHEASRVDEYWVYDPQGDLHDPRLQAWVLGPGGYEELADLKRPGQEVALWSEALGLKFHFDGTDLRMWDPVKQSYLRKLDESEEKVEALEAKVEAAEAERDAEKRARLAVEAELRRLRS